jgi:alpha-ketoglutarate-dependent taurine dioxygenase
MRNRTVATSATKVLASWGSGTILLHDARFLSSDRHKSTKPAITQDIEVRVSTDGSQLTLSVGENLSTSTFHAPWLWSNDPTHIHPSSGQRLRSPWTYYSTQAQIRFAELVTDDGSLDNLPIQPPRGSLHSVGGVFTTDVANDDITEDESHRSLIHVSWDTSEGRIESFYDLDWLLRCRYDSDALAKRHRETVVVKEYALCAGDVLQSLNFEQIVGTDNDESRYVLLHAVLEEGAALVRNAPLPLGDDNDTDAAVSIIGKMLAGGSLSHGHLYGEVFHVKSELNANNIAYTSVALSPHQDLSYYESPPGLQLLHCVEKSTGVHGGESVLIDALAAAEEFRSLAPDLFDVLLKCDATFLKQREGADMVYRRPHIQLAASGSNVVSVHWSPPFEGPLAIDSTLVDDYYVAYTAFDRMLDNSLPRLMSAASSVRYRLLPMVSQSLEAALCDYANTYTWEQRLEPGEILVFNNLRMLHGRRAFYMNISADRELRHLMGCYTNIDDTLNEYRLLRRERFHYNQELPYRRNAGNGSSSTN